MHKILFFSVLMLFSLSTSYNNILIEYGAKCTGSSTCSACKNCSSCGHCSNGGSCGVCISFKSNGKNPKKSVSNKNNKAVSNKIRKIYGTKSSPSSSRIIYTGPRGGRYYINSNGNKTYIK